jgi:uncharacterized glyoxalase superfamily protein PhnB
MASFRSPQVNFFAEDIEAIGRFYCEHFGFRETFRVPREGIPEHIELRLEGLTIGFGQPEVAQFVHGYRGGTGGATAELALVTDDVDATWAELLASGCGPVSAPHDFLEGRLRSASVTDPAGNILQFVTPLREPC